PRRPGTRGGGSGLLVEEELARAVRSESALAIHYWWGVVPSVVWRRRKALGVEPLNEGSARLRKALNADLGRAMRGVPVAERGGKARAIAGSLRGLTSGRAGRAGP